jgi:hypothetical protein
MIKARFVIREACVDIREASNGIPTVHGDIRGESRDDSEPTTAMRLWDPSAIAEDVESQVDRQGRFGTISSRPPAMIAAVLTHGEILSVLVSRAVSLTDPLNRVPFISLVTIVYGSFPKTSPAIPATIRRTATILSALTRPSYAADVAAAM